MAKKARFVKKARPLSRKQILEAVAAECAEKGLFFPSLELKAPTRPTSRYCAVLNVKTGEITHKFEFCDTRQQMKLVLVADKLLSEIGFFDEAKAKSEWLECEYNRSWFEAANPNSITSDGHLAASAAFC